MYEICNISLAFPYVQHEFLYPGWIYEMYAINYMSNMIFYVQDGSTKCMLYVVLALFLFLT